MPGESAPAGRWHELLAAGRAFHAAVRHERRPEFLQRRQHRWAVADRLAWGEASADPVPELEPVLAKLVPLVQAPTRGEVPQVVHGDLAGNVLFAPGLPPAIIDFSPYWRPTTYAAAIVAVDGVLWFGADSTSLRQVADEACSTTPLVRAIIFRLIALNERSRFDRSALDELPIFLNAASAIERLHVSSPIRRPDALQRQERRRLLRCCSTSDSSPDAEPSCAVAGIAYPSSNIGAPCRVPRQAGVGPGATVRVAGRD